jgi:ABC-type Co2+ transport system permease subunit
MIAANFYRNGFNFFYPQIDWAGNEPGYVGTEFPLVPYLAALAYVPFGIHDWIGRSVSVAFFALSVPYFWMWVNPVGQFRYVFAWWAVAIGLFVVLAGEGNHRHEWYRLPLVPVASAYAGAALDLLWRRVSGHSSYRWGLALVGIVLGSFAVMSARSVASHYDPWALPARNLGLELHR